MSSNKNFVCTFSFLVCAELPVHLRLLELTA